MDIKQIKEEVEDAVDKALDYACISETLYDRISEKVIDIITNESALEWIPIENMLPEYFGWYLVYAPKYGDDGTGSKEHHNGVVFSEYDPLFGWSIENRRYKRPGLVWAWMPLPKPYQEGEHE